MNKWLIYLQIVTRDSDVRVQEAEQDTAIDLGNYTEAGRLLPLSDDPEEVFFLSQNEEPNWAYRGFRSTMVGDVFMNHNTKEFYMVMPVGFKKIDVKNLHI